MKNHIFLLLSLFITITSVHAQFQECNSPTTKWLKDVYFIDANAGVAVGDSGIIIQTLDGGLNWDIVMENDAIDFCKVKFFDDQIGMAIGSHIFRTEDGGGTWAEINGGNNLFIDIEILNDSTCLLSGTPQKLLQSTNKGLDWTVLVPDTFEHQIRMLSFIDENIGYAGPLYIGGAASTLKTMDGGNSWTEIEDASGEHFTIIEDISFVSEEKGFRGGWYDAHLMKTENDASSWEATNVPNTPGIGFGIYNFHIEKNLPNSYYACGWYGHIFKSTDGGSNWTRLDTDTGNTSLHSIYFIDDNHGWVVGEYGKIFRTNNGGELVGLATVKTDFNFTVYPNPTKNNLTILTDNDLEIDQISIIDQNGKFLFSKMNSHRLDVSKWPQGVYYVEVRTNKGYQTKKIIKE